MLQNKDLSVCQIKKSRDGEKRMRVQLVSASVVPVGQFGELLVCLSRHTTTDALTTINGFSQKLLYSLYESIKNLLCFHTTNLV